MINDSYDEQEDFFARYIKITSKTEVPPFFSRWCMISGIGAWLGRSTYIKFGDSKLYPTMYVMLLGVPGTRKSTGIKQIKRVLASAGYSNFSAEKTTKEKFLMDLAGIGGEETASLDFLSSPFEDETAESYIAADEFNDFFGNNILDFVSLLGVLWDYEGTYRSKIKNGVSVELAEPTISILGGNTQSTFAGTFPPEVVGQGFFSRLVAVYAEPTGKKITFPEAMTKEEQDFLLERLFAMKNICVGEMTVTQEAISYIDTIYKSYEPIEDERFAHYNNRRLTHLFKLLIVHAAARLSTEIDTQDVVQANTVLTYTEHYMPKAYGEYGRSKNATSTHKVLGIIESSALPITFNQVWGRVSLDVTDLNQLSDILKNLCTAKKIQVTEQGFLPNKKPVDVTYGKYVNYKYITKEELQE